MLATLVVLAPMYGGGAILVRETIRRAGLGWPSIIVLALAYGVLEEGLVTQSLFNPNYLGLNRHLLQSEYIPALGIGAWWTVFVLTLHAVWSIPVPIAIVEAVSPYPAARPWLRRPGLALVAILFALACASVARFTVRQDTAHFVAWRAQLASTAAVIAALIVRAFRLPKPGGVHIKYQVEANCPPAPVGGPNRAGNAVFAAGLMIVLVAAAVKIRAGVE